MSYFSIRLLRRLGLLKKVYVVPTATIGNRVYQIPLVEGCNEGMLYLRPGFKTQLLERLAAFTSIDSFVDIGANLGQTMLEVLAYRPAARYFGFEPNPVSFGILQKIARANRLTAELFPCACGSSPGAIRLISEAAWQVDTAATIMPTLRSGERKEMNIQWICCYPLDSLTEQMGLPKHFVLKIDVEGAEMQVLEGARQSIADLRPLILCEVLHAQDGSRIPENDAHKGAIESLLRQQGYSIYLCEMDATSGETLSKLSRVSSFARGKTYRDSPHTCDYLFLPSEFDSRIERDRT